MLKIFHKRGQKGFTLIELMIVIAIIGILAAIAIPQFMYYKKKGAVAILNSDCKNAYLATIAYFVDNPNASTITYPILRYAGFTATEFVTLDTDNFVDQENFTIICQGSPNWLVAPAEVRVTNAELKLVESFILR